MNNDNPCGCDDENCVICGFTRPPKPRPPEQPAVWIDPHEPPVKGERKKKTSKSDKPGGLFDE